MSLAHRTPLSLRGSGRLDTRLDAPPSQPVITHFPNSSAEGARIAFEDVELLIKQDICWTLYA